MRTETDIVYSNDLCSAFLTAIVRSFEEHHPGRYLGRTAMQKLAYFAKTLGVPIPCSFGIYTYGPYSDTITFSVESLLVDEVLVDRSTNPKYSNYRTGRNSAELLSAYAEEVEPHEDTINRMIEALGQFEHSDLELIATLHFVARRQKQRTGKANKTAILAEFKSIKKDKFTNEDISTWYNALQQANLI
jgi:uncharacterized protein YwgA